MSNLKFLNNVVHFFISKLRFSPPTTVGTAHTPPSHCYFTSNPISSADDDNFFSTSFDADDSISDDLADVFASRRFFFSSPGRSNSIFEYSSAAHRRSPEIIISEGFKVLKYSIDPYADFRKSMQEMVEARELNDVRSDTEFLRELLSCYLRLNPKKTHKFIVKAFADLVLCLLTSSSSAPAPASKDHRKVVGLGYNVNLI